MGKLLLTGGSGLLALNWARAMAGQWGINLALNRRPVVLAGTESRVIDLASADAIGRALDQVEPELVIHTAGLTDVERCEQDPAEAHLVNVTIAENIALRCAARNIKLVHISTDHLFDGTMSMVDERQSPYPLNVYGRSKAEGEARVLAAAPSAIVARTNFYGWGPSYRRSFSDRIIDSLRRDEPIGLFEDVYFTPILADYLVEAVHGLVEAGAEGIYNVTGDQRLSKYDFGLEVASAFGLDQTLVRSARLSDRGELTRRPLEMSLCNKKVVDRLGHKMGDVATHLDRLLQLESQLSVKKVQQL
ncbi:MAG: SDR family oxidoreductase [Cypionkella sp.]